MVNRRQFPALILATLAWWTTGKSLGAVPFFEDLSACKLTNAVQVLPAAGTPQAAKGDVLRLSNNSFVSFPTTENGRVLTTQEALLRMRAAGAGDLQYNKDNDGSLLAVSGRISELGVSLLSDAAHIKLSVPMEIRATLRGAAGVYPGVQEGRTYLVQSTDGHYALVRVLEKSPAAIVIQYVYQKESLLSFDVPPGELVDYHRPPGTSTAVTTAPVSATPRSPTETVSGQPGMDETPPTVRIPVPPASLTTTERPPTFLPPPSPRPALGPEDRVEPGVIVLRSGSTGTSTAAASSLEPSMDTFMRQRNQMVERRMAIVQSPARTPADVDRKVQAIVDLANLHADEAADLLVSQISFFNARGSGRELSPDISHPALAALKHLGKSGSRAALKELRLLDPEAPGEGIDAPMYRAKLLGNVILAVEGNEAGEYILRHEMEGQTDSKRRAMFEYLLKE